MKYLFIAFLFISSFISGQGIEPTSLQPTQYQGGILRGVIPYVDEFTGETLYIYQHVDSLAFIKDSIYVRNDSIFLRDGTGFAIVTDSIYVVTGVSKDTIKLRDGDGYALVDKALSNGVKGVGTATRVAWWGGTDSLSSSDNLYFDNTRDQLGIGTSSPNSYVYDGYNGLSIYDATSARIGMANSTLSWLHYLWDNEYRIYNTNHGETFKLRGGDGKWQGGAYQSAGTSKAAYFDVNGILNKGDFDLLDGTGTAGYAARWFDVNTIERSGLYFPNSTSNQMGLGTTNPGAYLLNGFNPGFTIYDALNYPAFSMGTPTRNWIWYVGVDDLHLFNSNNGEFLYFDDLNRMGINTTSPQRSLHVQGEVRITDLLTDTPTRLVGADSDGDLGAVIVSNGLTIDGSGNLTGNINGTQNRIAKFTSQYAVGNSEIYTIGDTLVGINQSYPQYHLDVSGKFRVTQRLGAAATGAGFTSDGQLVSYSLDTAASTPNTYLSSGTNISITGDGTMGDPYTINNTSPENTSVKDGTHLDFSELSNDTITATIIAASIGPTEIAPTSVTPGTYTLSSITVDADGRITAASNGSDAVGVSSIATTSPITGGTITSSGTIGINDAAADGSTKGASSFTASDFNSSLGLISIDYVNGQAAASMQKGFLTSTDWNTFNGKIGGSGTTNYVPKFTGSTTIGNSDLYDGGSSKIGIGTTSPSSYLVDGGLAVYQNSNPGLALANSSSTWLNYLNGSNYRIYNFSFGEVATFTSGGRFGIGNISPSYTLDVSGDVRITSRSGTPQHGAAWDINGKLVTTGVAAGSVTSIAVTNGTGISATVSNPTTTPNITITNTGVTSVNGATGAVTVSTLPSGTTNQTLRHNGSSWVATSGMTVTSGNRVDINSWGGTVNLGSRLLVNGHIQYTNTGFQASTLTGRDTDGGLTGVTVGSGLSLSSGTLTATDASTTNELQTISTSGAAGNITLSGSGGTLNLNVNDADASTTNEIQTLSYTAPTLSLSLSGGSVTLSQQYGQMSANGGCASVATSWSTTLTGSNLSNQMTASGSTITVPATGTYELNYSGYFILDPTAVNAGVGLRVRRNGSSTTSSTIMNIQGTGSTEYRSMAKQLFVSLNSGDTIVLQATTDGGTVNVCDYIMNLKRIN